MHVRIHALTESLSTSEGRIFLLYGDDRIFPFALRITAVLMLQGKTVAVVDGCNRMNIHLLARIAQQRRIDPEAFLRQVYISRGFTCYQIEQAVIHRLPAFLNTIGTNYAVILGLLDTLYDEQAQLREVQQMLERMKSKLQALKSQGVNVLIVCQEYHVVPEARNRLLTVLKEGMDEVYRLTGSNTAPELHHEKGTRHGTNSRYLHQHHRPGDGLVVQIPTGIAEGRPGNL
jgi:hypothetical protein